MARKLLRPIVTIATSLLLSATILFGLSLWQRSEDAKWCRDAIAEKAVPGNSDRPGFDFLERQRSACANHRQRQRVMFGSVWRTDGRRTAECGFELARVQLLSDDGARRAILERYGIDPAGFEASSRDDQDRFVQRCLSAGPNGSR